MIKINIDYDSVTGNNELIETGQESKTMNIEKFTTKQLKNAMIELHGMKEEGAIEAYQLAFDELLERMGDDAFDTFCDGANI